MMALVAIVGIALVISAKVAPVERTLEQQSGVRATPDVTPSTAIGIAKIISTLK